MTEVPDALVVKGSWLFVTWAAVPSQAARRVANGCGDDLVVLPRKPPTEEWQTALYAAAQHDDGVSALAAIDVLRILIALYETDPAEHIPGDENRCPCGYWAIDADDLAEHVRINPQAHTGGTRRALTP